MNRYTVFFNNYDITKDGIITNFKTNKKSKGHLDDVGYLSFQCKIDGKNYHIRIHQLLATKYIPNPNNYPCVNHKDGNKLNNSLDNLEWCSYSYNNKHAYDNRLKKPRTKGTEIVQINIETKEEMQCFKSIREAGRKTGICSSLICEVCKGKYKQAGGYIWKYKEVV